MLRLPPTTISLTITEVKEFERHSRFKKYLAKEDALGNLPTRTRIEANATRSDLEQCQAKQTNQETLPKPKQEIAERKSPKLLAYPPRRPPKVDEGSNESSRQAALPSSPSVASTSSTIPQYTDEATAPTIFPPLLTSDVHSASDEASFPSVATSTRSQTTREDASREAPATPPRRSSLSHNRPDIGASPLPSGGASRTLSSAVRFVESVIRSTRIGSPSPSARDVASESGSPARADADDRPGTETPRFRIYNDSLPASSQPQTPLNLPEARHQSRFRGAYTAPVSRVTSRQAHHSRTRPDRTRSPSGMDTPGFRGLYGGLENSDDSRLFSDASRARDGDISDA
ncbi:hypothetical protein F4780DRAFT_774693 [Xylariomycetidae sp. FL0641]|nr:hypothetical protein F4780DRAFT_774693 [Xylariomycetidae sp. FL0641]